MQGAASSASFSPPPGSSSSCRWTDSRSAEHGAEYGPGTQTHGPRRLVIPVPFQYLAQVPCPPSLPASRAPTSKFIGTPQRATMQRRRPAWCSNPYLFLAPTPWHRFVLPLCLRCQPCLPTSDLHEDQGRSISGGENQTKGQTLAVLSQHSVRATDACLSVPCDVICIIASAAACFPL